MSMGRKKNGGGESRRAITAAMSWGSYVWVECRLKKEHGKCNPHPPHTPSCITKETAFEAGNVHSRIRVLGFSCRRNEPELNTDNGTSLVQDAAICKSDQWMNGSRCPLRGTICLIKMVHQVINNQKVSADTAVISALYLLSLSENTCNCVSTSTAETWPQDKQSASIPIVCVYMRITLILAFQH